MASTPNPAPALAALRRRRSLHPTGIGYQGWLEIPAEHPGPSEVPLFQAGVTHPAILRFSRGAGLPEPLPDALGVAIKLPDAHGPGAGAEPAVNSSWPQALRAVRAWLGPWSVLGRCWRAWSPAPPPAALQRLLDGLAAGRPISLYLPP